MCLYLEVESVLHVCVHWYSQQPLAVSSIEKLSQYVDQRQLTFDLGGTLPYNHEEWIQLRLVRESYAVLDYDIAPLSCSLLFSLSLSLSVCLSLSLSLSLSVSSPLSLSMQNLEHFVASYNALMEHTSHLEQQMLTEQLATTVEEVEELVKSHEEFNEQLQKTPKSTLREADDLLTSIQQQHGEAGASG